MSETCPTVRVQASEQEDGFKVINEADFVEGVDVLFDTPELKAAPASANPDAPDFVAMDRDALVAYLEANEIKVWPNTGEEKLREKCVEFFASLSAKE